MRMPIIILLLGIALMQFCKDDFGDDKILEFDHFELRAPSNWHKIEETGYDSYVGAISNNRDTLHFDYGWYSYDFRNESTETHFRSVLNIDGFDALLVRPKVPGKGLIGVYIDMKGKQKFNMYGISGNEAAVIDIFRSIKFK